MNGSLTEHISVKSFMNEALRTNQSDRRRKIQLSVCFGNIGPGIPALRSSDRVGMVTLQ